MQQSKEEKNPKQNSLLIWRKANGQTAVQSGEPGRRHRAIAQHFSLSSIMSLSSTQWHLLSTGEGKGQTLQCHELATPDCMVISRKHFL